MNIKRTCLVAAAMITMGSGFLNFTHSAKAVGVDTSHMSKKPVNYGKFVNTYPKWIRGTWYSYSSDGLSRIQFTKHTFNAESAKNNSGSSYYKNKPAKLHYYSKGHTKQKNWLYAQVGSSTSLSSSYKITTPYSDKVLVSNGFSEPSIMAIIISLHKYGSNEALVQRYGIGYSAVTGYFRSISVAKHYKNKSLPGFGKQD